jgi:hypothetical protein
VRPDKLFENRRHETKVRFTAPYSPSSDRFRYANAIEIVPNRSWYHRLLIERREIYATLNICRRPRRSANRSLRSPMGCAGSTALNFLPETTDCLLSELIGDDLGNSGRTSRGNGRRGSRLELWWQSEPVKFRACQNPALSPRPRGSLNRKMGSRGEAGFLRELPPEDNSKGPAASNDTVGTPLLTGQ